MANKKSKNMLTRRDKNANIEHVADEKRFKKRVKKSLRKMI